MKSKVKDKLVGVYAPGSYDHTSVLGQTQEFSMWFWENRKDMDLISCMPVEPARMEGDWLSYEIQDYRLLRQYARQ